MAKLSKDLDASHFAGLLHILHSWGRAHEVSDNTEDFQISEEHDHLRTVILWVQMSKAQVLADKCEEHKLRDQAFRDQVALMVCLIDQPGPPK